MKLDHRATIEDLMRMPEDGQKYELVDGEIVVSPAGYRHSVVGGVTIVWLVDPAERTVTVYRSLSNIQRFTSNDTITGEPVLPGFSCAVSRFFEPGPG